MPLRFGSIFFTFIRARASLPYGGKQEAKSASPSENPVRGPVRGGHVYSSPSGHNPVSPPASSRTTAKKLVEKRPHNSCPSYHLTPLFEDICASPDSHTLRQLSRTFLRM